MPERLDLILEVFDALDKDGDGQLNEQELLKFARCYEFYDLDERWSTVYRGLCDSFAVDADSGFGATAFVTLVDTETRGCYCNDVLLRWILEEISPKAPAPPSLPLPPALPGHTAMNEAAAMLASLQRVKAHAQGFRVPEFEYSKPMENHPLMGLPGVPGLPGFSAADAAKLIAAGGIKRGDSKPPGVGSRRKIWIDCPWLQAQPFFRAPEEVPDPSQDLDPLGIDALPDELDPLGIDSLPETLDPLGIDELADVMPAEESGGIETVSIRRLKPKEAAESASRAQKLKKEAARPPAWLCEQFPRRKHWRSWRVCSLRVDEEVGAGLELEATYAGHRVHDVDHFPGQAEALCAGTVIMCIDGHPLVGLDEESLDEAFDDRFRDGAEVMLMDWDELCEALDEKQAEPDSDSHGMSEGTVLSSARESHALSVDGSWLPANGSWKRGSGRRVVAGASQKQRKVHERLETMAADDDGEDDGREATPLDRFNPNPLGSSRPVISNCQEKQEAIEDDTEASRKLFFDLAGPAPCTDICELVPQTSFTQTVKTYAGEGMQESNAYDFTLGEDLELKYMTDNGEGVTPAVDPTRDMRWVSLEERYAMEAAHDTRPRRSRAVFSTAVVASSSSSRDSKRSQPLETQRRAVAASGGSFDSIGSWALEAQASLEEDAEQKPKSKPAAKAMAPMPKARPLGGGPRPLGGGQRPLTLGGQPASSGSFGVGSRGYPLGASSSSWTGRPADDEMGEFYSFRIPKSAAKPRQPKFGEQLGQHREVEAAARVGELAKAKPKSVEGWHAWHVTEETVDVD